MRLLTAQDDGNLIFTKDLTSNIPPYAILSHTWGPDDDEVTFKDIIKDAAKHKNGYKKIQFCEKQAVSDGLQYFWVDSCCIDKSNNNELSTAINSMFSWYYDSFAWEWAFRKSRWFTRGWTLQELIAPSLVDFFSAEGQRLGDKKSLDRQIHEITGIATAALRGDPLSDFSRRAKMSWAEGRTTKLEEDRAYSLIGIFEISLSPIYGEGVKLALRRLEEEIDKQEAFERGQLRGHKSEPVAVVPFSLNEAEKACLRSLWFPSMNTRRLNIEKPAEQTCLWLFSLKVYQDWFLGRDRDKHYGLLWLKGKPGAGKSTLMKEAFRQAVLGQDKSKNCTAAFFFDAKGGDLEKSPLGLFRSLLYQLLPGDPEHLRHFYALWDMENRVQYNNGSKAGPWHESQLRNFFQFIFRHQRTKRTIIFIDALDECDSKSIRSQASFWREITKAAYDAKVNLSVCISIRDFPTLTVPDCPEIVVENHNNYDIATYVKQKFTLTIAAKEPQWELLKDKILGKSAGVFLWVVLVVDDVLKKWDDGDSIPYLLKQLDLIPEGLATLFLQIVCSIDPKMRDVALRLFHWAVFAVKPLRLYEWHHILAFIRPPFPQSLREWRESDNFTKDDDQLEKKIRSISKGLVEVRTTKDDAQDESLEMISVCAGAGSLSLGSGETRVVQVVHESVREFFLQDNGFTAVGHAFRDSDPIGCGHLTIMATCLDYINIKELDTLIQARNQVAERRLGTQFTREDLKDPVERASSLRKPENSLEHRAQSPVHSKSKHRYHERTPSPPNKRIRSGKEQASPVKVLKNPSDPGCTEITRWLEMLPTSEYFDDPNPSNELAYSSLEPSLATGQPEVLEDYPALLSYATFEFFTHARLAEVRGTDPSVIIRHLTDYGSWARWVTLREDVPQGSQIIDYAARLGLHSWIKIMEMPKDRPARTRVLQESQIVDYAASVSPGSWFNNTPVDMFEPISMDAFEPISMDALEPISMDAFEPISGFIRRPSSVASFSSAGSHTGSRV
ncbi:hypothetical protein NUW58_g4084 [Xylaria curta]|uniref:Uncharacterized protein n=1 Tax=Xylaria curta TaxID=42375 RepID=A0ACC1PAJ4_9PEZI|nr:hypothetical protein NUW58_g4084 [Xylaria curta]